MTEREVLQYDVVIVGAGPAGLACAIRMKQLNAALRICVLEKASAVGSHSLSGAVLEPSPLDELFPTWRADYKGVMVAAREDIFRILTRTGSTLDWLFRLVPRLLPGSLTYGTPFNNEGNLIVSLGQLTQYLAQRAEATGIEVFAGFAAVEALFDSNGSVKGVRVGDMGREKDGTPGESFVPGVDLHAKLSIFAEGARGSISKQLIRRFDLSRGRDPQTFGLGYKELWQVPAGRVQPGRIEHFLGWPADPSMYAGGFVYHLDSDRAYVGYIVGLNYQDPRLEPFELFQQFKNHPHVRSLLEGGEIVSAGARAIAAGGWQSQARMDMPGALLIGDAAGTLNFLKIKGVHQAIRCGVAAADFIHANAGRHAGFDRYWRASAGGQELRRVRNAKPAFKNGMWPGLLSSAWELLVGGRSPWTLKNPPDFAELKKLDEAPLTDRNWSLRTLPPRDRLASVFYAGTAHRESQPVHLELADESVCFERCTREFGNPCERFCPAGVYEMVRDSAGRQRLQINAANCIHCKACDIKDPYELITWTSPEGGSGPNYQIL